ncbi:hypothetical protein ABIE62_002022 [Porphyrobacter sp. MBR-155]|jgi:hypothetical protein|uniref:DUF2889 domain-containing protein n=1 Tax=Porphyrobacter sp. MBR-155 TaxID=3156464 RepID=UPI003390EEE4
MSTQNPPQQFAFARQSAGHAPLRRPGSIRRTTSIDSDWPEGFGEPWDMVGRARDLLTPVDGGEPQVLATGGFQITCSPLREILKVAVAPDHPAAGQLVGVRAGGASRHALASIMGDIQGTPTFQLLDDYAGASLVAGWIWSQWRSDWATGPQRATQKSTAGRNGRMDDICTGFAVGSSAFKSDGSPDNTNQSFTEVGPLENPDDPIGWHPMPFQQGPQKRRARRIDLWRAEGVIMVDAGFQDSGSNPAGGRTAIHEYRVHAEIDAESGVLLALQALPLILPFRECPGASVKATRLIGKPVAEFRPLVLETLPSTMGCTHLNDVLRALADIPSLARLLP